jgi:hypothetical protein
MSRSLRHRARIVLVVASAVLCATSLLAGCDKSPDEAAAGDCISGSDANSMKVVDCTDPSAAYTVTQIVGNPSEGTDALQQCTDSSTTDAWEEFVNESLSSIVCLRSLSSDGSAG